MFLLSSDTSTDRVVQIITYLGGRYIQTHEYVQMISITISTFAAEATHLLTASPKRTEKFLGAIACGMWILKPTYLDAYEKAGKWVSEEAYEWCEVDPKSRIDGSVIRRRRIEGSPVFVGARYSLELIVT